MGEMLQLRRREKDITLERSAKATKIKLDYLRALENGEYDKLPNGIYGKSFLKEYCLFLGLKYKHLLPLYEREQSIIIDGADPKKIFSRRRAQRRYFFLLPKLWRSIILVLVVFAGLFYLGYRIKAIVAPPEMEIFFPPQNYSTNENLIQVSGNIEKDALLFINDSVIITQENGDFLENINLKKGINIIIIKAQKKYGKDLVVIRQILVE
ncbi:hypothetical protein COT95_02735 [Candidatus Falkowbacteria bacterium CG10_big_fil_rev_8_21_14_0_10_37_6]|uniref:HTH cro/C1-type domain-containing protein n=1 Tax=Candidatus Falkowbacteria bacterium CG10_big_fil_rev_8_21_14_0_10_37_6 TaxID=1974563 RepID=A0A2H0V6M6_9BACT|nr:MAG: hypothetical protein COT95_02735 [Candidatus Falkowbacteria bacterium CG10_big_fil_rev_8_21_14_0_10_37_6]